MANFAAALDRDPERRARFVERARRDLRLRTDLAAGEVAEGALAVVWMAASGAPVDPRHEEGRVSVLWGDARSAAGDWLDAAGAARSLDDTGSPVDGYHAALTFDGGELRVGADLVGLFPVYYAHVPGVATLVSSSPSGVSCHPSFDPTLDHAGLAGVLLTGGPLDGRTLWRGVRRLAPGHVLRASLDGVPREVLRFALPVGGDLLDEDEDGAAEVLHAELTRAIGRSVRDGPGTTLMLSGGRDSRLVAAGLRRSGRTFAIQTLGQPGDHDERCAAAVARRLGVEPALGEVDMARFEHCARLHAHAEHLMGHASGLYNWGIGDVLAPGTRRVVTGHGTEFAGGGWHLDWAGIRTPHGMSWGSFRESISTHALEPALLRRLTTMPDLRDAIDELDAGLEARFRAEGETLDQQARGFLWKHWKRHHSGAFAWRVAFNAWPVLPIIDQELLRLAARISVGLAARRRLQDRVLAKYDPDLASAPLVRPSGSLEPVLPSARWKAGRAAKRVADEVRWRLPGEPARSERRYYHRVYDLDNAGWRSIRRLAEPFREHMHDLFDEAVLSELLPAPDRPFPLERPIADGYGRKTLLGLMLWFGQQAGGAPFAPEVIANEMPFG